MRFKDFNLEVVTVERSSFDYSMTINKNFVTFSKGIVQELDYPAQVLIAFNKETRVMGIQVCRAKTRGSFKFSKPEGEQKGIVQVMNKNLKETLLHIMPEWKATNVTKSREFTYLKIRLLFLSYLNLKSYLTSVKIVYN
ncbi:hypothetical protein [Streptococcus hyointestinalis]|uniref:hypothetical protein n=1 Tax=Streptococcus hyointestinalis TaxID=1337 RepID=UPI001F150CE0|nr:hypothetical protein [Streptococcus hyointestinalis]